MLVVGCRECLGVVGSDELLVVLQNCYSARDYRRIVFNVCNAMIVRNVSNKGIILISFSV